VPIEVCDRCGEHYSGPEAAKVEHEAICRTLGLPTPSEIVALRQRLGMSQAELARLTEIGKATISRWERGRMLPTRALARYLRLLERNPTNVKLLKTLASSPAGAVADSTHPPQNPAPGVGSPWQFEPVVGMKRNSEVTAGVK